MNDEEQQIDNKAHTAPQAEFPEPVRTQPLGPKEFPSSADKKFWGDAGIITANKQDIEKQREELFAITGKNHKPTMQGREFVCTSCPFLHTLPIDPNRYTMNHIGEVVPIDTTVRT